MLTAGTPARPLWPPFVIELANPLVCRIWGRRPEQVLGKPLFEALPEAAGQGFEQLVERVRTTVASASNAASRRRWRLEDSAPHRHQRRADGADDRRPARLHSGAAGGGIPIIRRPANLRSICQHVLEELESGHPRRELRLTASGVFQGEWDPDRLAQLLGNLGKNALDYSPEDSPVDFALRDEGNAVRVEVHNRGSPIPAEMLSRIFEPFRRASDEGHPTSGLGLGLFIVQQIVHSHEGRVEVRSTLEAGTTFTVWLPRAAPPLQSQRI